LGLDILTHTGKVQWKPKETSTGSPTVKKFGTFFLIISLKQIGKNVFKNRIPLQTNESNLQVRLRGEDEMLFFMPS
jgi:hypothetical protein